MKKCRKMSEKIKEMLEIIGSISIIFYAIYQRISVKIEDYIPKKVDKNYKSKLITVLEDKIPENILNISRNGINDEFSHEIYQKFMNEYGFKFLYYILYPNFIYHHGLNFKYHVLKREYDMLDLGCCFGMSIIFAKTWLTQKMYKDYSEGAGMEEKMIQIFHTQLSISLCGIHLYNYDKAEFLLNKHNMEVVSCEKQNALNMSELNNGTYLIELSFKNANHAIVIIKEETYTLFDPNHGTLINLNWEMLHELTKFIYENSKFYKLMRLSLINTHNSREE